MIKLFKNEGDILLTDSELKEHLDVLKQEKGSPFSNSLVNVLTTLSKNLISSPESKKFPQIAALGFWLRPSAIIRLKNDYLSRRSDSFIPVARGLAFHLPPSNVDTLFVYSWALSFLAGNANIVRLPSNVPVQTKFLLSQLLYALEINEEQHRQLFCTYDHQLGINKLISAESDLRIIWGGNDKVLSTSVDAIKPDGISIGFSDRRSLSIISASSYEVLSNEQKNALLTKFYNDVYWFDQLGCGSPRIVTWIGGSEDVYFDFYQRLSQVAMQKNYQIETGSVLNKKSFAFEQVAIGNSKCCLYSDNMLSVIDVTNSYNIPRDYVGGGFLFQSKLNDISDIKPYVNEKTQTITHFGFSKEEIYNMAHLVAVKGGFRLVPVGEALSFNETWDGISLLDMMTRQLHVQVN